MSLPSMFCKTECEQKFNCYIPKPSYHSKNKDMIIISTDYWEGNKKGIYECNTKRNTFNKIYTYKQGFEVFSPSLHGQFIDSKNELLYIFGHGKLGIFDLNSKVMNTNTTSALRDCRRCHQSTYIP
eukprot:255175_1